MALYRKKPITVEARQVGQRESWRSIAAWCGGIVVMDGRTIAGIVIETLEGKMWARKDDWILKGALGEFYPVNDKAFPLTFEPIGAPTTNVGKSLEIGAEVCESLCVEDSGHPDGTPCTNCDWCDMAKRLRERAGSLR